MLSALIIMTATVRIALSMIGTTIAVAFVFSVASSVTAAIFFIASMTTAMTMASRELLYFLHEFFKHDITTSVLHI